MNRNYKIAYGIKTAVSIFIFAITSRIIASAQSKIGNKYGLVVINNPKILRKEIRRNPADQMVDIKKFIPEIRLDLRYATANNFMHEELYPPLKTTFLRKPAAENLRKIEQELRQQNLGLAVFDAYRPYSVTELMWEKVHDDRYAADPSKGSGHNRGTAVDLTLIDLHTLRELPMGTGFDNFSDTAHSNFTALPPQVLHNRELLKAVMEKYGFSQLSTEWWHFYLPNSASFRLLDLPFAKLEKMAR